MRINAKTGNFEITPKEMERARIFLKGALRDIRIACKLPLDKYEREGPLQDAELAQGSVLELGKSIGIEFPGCHFGNEIDLRE